MNYDTCNFKRIIHLSNISLVETWKEFHYFNKVKVYYLFTQKTIKPFCEYSSPNKLSKNAFMANAQNAVHLCHLCVLTNMPSHKSLS